MMIQIPERIKKLATKKGYYYLWEREVSKGLTHEEAFWKVENEYRNAFQEKMYKNFESFRSSRRWYIKHTLSSN